MVRFQISRPFIKVQQIPIRGRRSRTYRSYTRTGHEATRHSQELPEADTPRPSFFSPTENASDGGQCSANTSHKESIATVEAWQRVRQILLGVSAELLCPPEEAACLVCSVSLTVESQLWQCSDCGSEAYFCSVCVKKVHQSTAVVHVLERWEAGEFQPKIPDDFSWMWSRKDGHQCQSTYDRLLSVFDSQGRCHDVTIQFCACETEVATLIRFSLWPATPKRPQSAISLKLMDMITRLQLECGASLKAICAAIQSSSLSSKCQDLYRRLAKESYEEYRHMRFQLSILRHLGPDITDGTQCPVCPQKNGTLVLAADGLFGLPRKKSSGRSFEGPKHFNRFFSPQDDVDKFVSKEQEQDTSEEGCANFQAGSALRSKVKTAKLDETGVFGIACKHEHPRRFLSLKRGESLSNAVFLIKELQEDLGKNKKLVFMYDIGCKLKPHLEVSHSCRNVEGAGLSDGEQLERLWSFLRRFGKITKEMTPSHRVDLLTDALLHYSSKTRKSQAKALRLKAEKNNSVEDEAKREMAELMKQTGLTELDVQQWAEQYKTGSQKSIEWTWEEDYVQKLVEHQELESLNSVSRCNPDLSTRLAKLEKKLLSVERKQRLRERWSLTAEPCLPLLGIIEEKQRQHSLQAIYNLVLERKFLCGLVRKYADGQKIAIRLSKKITTLGHKIKRKLNDFNTCTRAANQPVQYHEVLQLDNPIWSTMVNSTNDVEMSVKQRLFVLMNTAKRAAEEKTYLAEDCLSGKSFYEKQIQELDKCLLPDTLQSVSSRQDKGANAALLSKRREFSGHLTEFDTLLSTLDQDVLDKVVYSSDSDISSDSDTDSDEEEEAAHTSTQ